MNEETSLNYGIQRIDTVMLAWQFDNNYLVNVSTEQLTHKQVQKARQGRRLTLKMMQKVARALNVAIWKKLNDAQKERYVEYMHRDFFSYAKGFVDDSTWVDANAALLAEIKG